MLARREDPHWVTHGNPPDRDRRSWRQDRVDLYDAMDPHLAARPDHASGEEGRAGGQEAAVVEVERFERSPDPTNFALADAQRVLARAYGFSSWAALKNYVEGVNFQAFLAAVEAGDVAAVRRLAKARPDLINHHDESRGSALHRDTESDGKENCGKRLTGGAC